MSTITLSRNKIVRDKGVVVLPVAEYQDLLERAVPEYHLVGKAARSLDALVDQGLHDYYTGKTIRASSVKEALRVYAKKNNPR